MSQIKSMKSLPQLVGGNIVSIYYLPIDLGVFWVSILYPEHFEHVGKSPRDTEISGGHIRPYETHARKKLERMISNLHR